MNIIATVVKKSIKKAGTVGKLSLYNSREKGKSSLAEIVGIRFDTVLCLADKKTKD